MNQNSSEGSSSAKPQHTLKTGFTPLDSQNHNLKIRARKAISVKLIKDSILWGRNLTGFTPLERHRLCRWSKIKIANGNIITTSDGREMPVLTGFTVIELVVVMSMIIMVSSVVLVGFSSLPESVAINRASRELILDLRRAQNISLAVTQVQGSLIPIAGVKLTSDLPESRNVILFGDLNDNPVGPPIEGNGKYDTPPDRLIEQRLFARNAVIKTLKDQDNSPVSVAHIIFSAPEANMRITDIDGVSIGNLLTIELGLLNGTKIKTITVRTSGQISTQ